MAIESNELLDAIKEVARLKGQKRRNGTKIHYAELRVKRLKENPPSKTRSNSSPRSPQTEKKVLPLQAKGSPENRAYVLSREIYDLTQAIVALERLR